MFQYFKAGDCLLTGNGFDESFTNMRDQRIQYDLQTFICRAESINSFTLLLEQNQLHVGTFGISDFFPLTIFLSWSCSWLCWF